MLWKREKQLAAQQKIPDSNNHFYFDCNHCKHLLVLIIFRKKFRSWTIEFMPLQFSLILWGKKIDSKLYLILKSEKKLQAKISLTFKH
jgi:hypothetical protein